MDTEWLVSPFPIGTRKLYLYPGVFGPPSQMRASDWSTRALAVTNYFALVANSGGMIPQIWK